LSLLLLLLIHLVKVNHIIVCLLSWWRLELLLTKVDLLVEVWLLLLLLLLLGVKARLREATEHVEAIIRRLLLGSRLLEVIEHLVIRLVCVAKVGHEISTTWHLLRLHLLLLLHVQTPEKRVVIHGLLLLSIHPETSNIVIERLSGCHV
jgi:hypothetical protein